MGGQVSRDHSPIHCAMGLPGRTRVGVPDGSGDALAVRLALAACDPEPSGHCASAGTDAAATIAGSRAVRRSPSTRVDGNAMLMTGERRPRRQPSTDTSVYRQPVAAGSAILVGWTPMPRE